MDAGVISMIRLAAEDESERGREAACQMFESIRVVRNSSEEMVTVLDELNANVGMVGGLSRDLRRPLTKIQQALGTSATVTP